MAARSGVTLVLALLVACSAAKSHPRPAPTTAPRRPSTTSTTLAPVAALTGLPVADPGALKRPAVIVKVDNAPDARPQAGLDQADVVIEEKVEGGVTRLMVVFQSHEAGLIGPVRSVRSTDPNVVKPIGGLFAYSGGIRPFITLLDTQGGVIDVGYDAFTKAYSWRNDRPRPHNLYTSTAGLRPATPAGLGPPPALFTYLARGRPLAGAGAAPATHLRVPFGLTMADWQWDPTSVSWLRSTDGAAHRVEGGGQLAFTTLVVQFVPYVRTPYLDPARAPVDAANVVGTGDAWVLADGIVVKGHWTKLAPSDVTAFTDSSGQAIAIPPGRTWISLAPIGAAAQT